MVPINATLLSRTFHLAVTGAAPSREAQLLLLSMRCPASVPGEFTQMNARQPAAFNYFIAFAGGFRQGIYI